MVGQPPDAAAGVDGPRYYETISVTKASDIGTKPNGWAPTLGVVIVVLGAIVEWLLYSTTEPADFVPKSDYSVFAGLFILAAALERLLEPFTPAIKPDTAKTKKELNKAVEEANTDPTNDTKTKKAADTQAQLNRERAERSVLLWGIATALSMLACSLLGVFLLRSVADVTRCDPKADASASPAPVPAEPELRTPRGCTDDDPNRFLDLIVTGLVVGAGTKPLHDLITRFEVKKEQAQDPLETNPS